MKVSVNKVHLKLQHSDSKEIVYVKDWGTEILENSYRLWLAVTDNIEDAYDFSEMNAAEYICLGSQIMFWGEYDVLDFTIDTDINFS